MNVYLDEQVQLLISGGLTKLEAKIYLLLLQKSNLNGNEIAAELGVERSLIYRSLKSISEKQLIVSSNERYNCKYSVADTQTLVSMTDKNLKKATESFEAVKKFVNQIPMISLEGVLKSKVRVFRGEESITKLYSERNNSGDPVIREISSDTVFPMISNEWWDHQIEVRKNHHSFLQQLVDVADKSLAYHRTNKEQFKEVRQVPEDFSINAGINIFGDRIAFHNSSVSDPMSLIIEDVAMAKLMKNMFDFIWNRSKVI